jgi:prepilin-type N-terminal cleavage/methylation domain-containing protein
MTIEHRHCPGMTLLELLLVIAIFATFMGLLMVAIFKIRRTADMLSCQNNLRQIGLALHNYHASNKHFPPGSVEIAGKETDIERSWVVDLLPFIGEDNLFTRYNEKVPWNDPANSQLVGMHLSILQCPSYSGPEYVGSSQRRDYQVINNVHGYYVGVMCRNLGHKLSDITDGASKTVMIMEMYYGAGWANPFPQLLGGASNRWLSTFSNHSVVNALMADGSIWEVSKTMTTNELAPFVTIDKGD